MGPYAIRHTSGTAPIDPEWRMAPMDPEWGHFDPSFFRVHVFVHLVRDLYRSMSLYFTPLNWLIDWFNSENMRSNIISYTLKIYLHVWHICIFSLEHSVYMFHTSVYLHDNCCHCCNIVETSIEVTIPHIFHHRCSSDENTAVAAISYKFSLVFEIPSNIQSSQKKESSLQFRREFNRRHNFCTNSIAAAVPMKTQQSPQFSSNSHSSLKFRRTFCRHINLHERYNFSVKSVATISSQTQSWLKLRRQFRNRFNFA